MGSSRRRVRPELLLLLLAACQLGTEGGPPGGGGGVTVVPTATPAGVPQGSPVSASIGAAGGVVSSAGGEVRLTVPAGAVTAPTLFRVTPISSRAPGALGSSFRIEAGAPFTGQVQVTFRGLGAYRAGLDARSLAIRWQDPRGFWLAPDSVTRDVGGDTVTASTSHLSDWALVLTGTPALEGTFSLVQAVGLPFAATGTAALYAAPGDEPTYLLTGTLTIPAQLAWQGATCVPDAPAKDLVLSVAEVHGAVFRWGINALWGLTCTDDVSGAVSSRELATLFDTLRINLVRCPGQYVGTQVNGAVFVQGGYTSDCGVEGTVSSSWDFRGCTPGGACVPADPCLTGTVSCSLGIGTCNPGPRADPGTPCGTGQVCDAAGACLACTEGGGCTPANVCLGAGTGVESCGAGPACNGGIPVAAGTVTCSAAGAPGICDGLGLCVPCQAGLGCTPLDPCHVGITSCATGAQTCVDTSVLASAGTACGVGQVCDVAGACVACSDGASCTPANTCLAAGTGVQSCSGGPACGGGSPVPAGSLTCDAGGAPGICDGLGLCVPCQEGLACVPANVCGVGFTTCSTGAQTCLATGDLVAAGTACGTNQVCDAAGACVACTDGAACTPANTCLEAGSGIQSCSGGPVCGGGLPVAAGSLTCDAGGGAPGVCDGLGLCVPCQAGLACTPANACDFGLTSCATGAQTCADTGLPALAGTTCGTDQVCNGSGACVACTAGSACTPANVCLELGSGIQSCSAGPVCGGGLPVPPGSTTCDAGGGTPGICDGLGLCVPCQAGLACTPTNACDFGLTTCATGAQTCVDTGLPADGGLACGTDQVCDGSGTCVACADGSACSPANTCLAAASGIQSCSGGPACGGGTPVAPGSLTCDAGGVPGICDGTGLCLPCQEGLACVPASACNLGLTSCSTGAQTCTDTGQPASAGLACGTDQVCDGSGACVACTDGSACTPSNTCLEAASGIQSCSGGPVCGGGTPVAAGSLTCDAGGGAPGICDGLGTCVPCQAGLACTPANACDFGLTSCSTGAQTCTDTGLPADAGLICGADRVCDGSGACVACTEGGPCTPSNACLEPASGIQSCSAGPACGGGLPVAAGSTTCDAGGGAPGICDGTGSCVPCRAGLACVPANACDFGLTSCSTGAQVCVDTGLPVDAGTTCGTDQVCNGSGACAACTPGASCTPSNGCLAAGSGLQSCIAGPVCGGGTPVAPGSLTCDAGGGTPGICDGLGLCVPCQAGLACVPANACDLGLTSCSTGAQVCTDTGQPAGAGLACGTDQVCNGSGACVACTEGGTCTPSNPCLGAGTGVESCTAGPVCGGGTPVAAGSTTCDASGAPGICDGAGACVPCEQGLACVPASACNLGLTSCSTGAQTCTDTGQPAGAGLACGTDQVCDGAGACVACTDGAACTPANTCLAAGSGLQSCSGGPACGGGTPVAAGSLTCDAGGGAPGICDGTGLCLPCQAGLACVPANACDFGLTSCATGAQTCTDTGLPALAGTVCGASQVCNGSGACVACTAGSACTPPNVCLELGSGTQSCSGGPACGGGLPVAAGSTTCDAGGGTPGICDGTGFCVACQAGLACVPANACDLGLTSCASGAQTCTDTGLPADGGLSCGTDLVCDGSGACLACTAGSACTPANACLTAGSGTQSCSGGPVCGGGTPVAAGSLTCDAGGGAAGICDGGGLCVACQAGLACVPANACHTGTTSCSTGAQTCADTGLPASAGTTCGANQVCDGAGACVACTDGASCTPVNACLAAASGTQSCSGGPVCGGGSPVAAGSTTCDAGGGAAGICDGLGTCVPCQAGLACTPANACDFGLTTCSTGAQTCADTGLPALPGTTCGTDQVCNGSGACVACTVGGACTPANVCLELGSGTQSCSGGPSCGGGLPVAAGSTTCDAGGGAPGICDGTGFCVACQAGLACTPTNACDLGLTSCATGAQECTDTGLPADGGTVCGTDQVCDGSGACVACTAGSACTPTNVCLEVGSGTVSCSGGPVCGGGTPVAAGSLTCDAAGAPGICDGGGLCVPCQAGLACTPANACDFGLTSCSTGAQTCTDTGLPALAGTTCGTDQVCNGGGACVACTEGGTCTPASACLEPGSGTQSCSGGPTCGGGTPVAAGSTTCDAGGGTPGICDGLGLCVPCQAGLACTPANACDFGLTSCSTGAQACADTGLPALAGTTCGTDLVCNGSGACVACTAGSACTPANACLELGSGTLSCSGGPVCGGGTPVAAGSLTCDAGGGTPGICDGLGLCVPCQAGLACTPANVCDAGLTSCTTGAQACDDTFTPLLDGTPCTTVAVPAGTCLAGVCQ